MRIASHPETRWTKRQQNGIQASALQSKQSRVGRPRKRWEDDVNQVLKSEETEETRENDMKTNDAWIWLAKIQKRWKDMEEDYIKRQLTPPLS